MLFTEQVAVAPHEELNCPVFKPEWRSEGFGSVHFGAFPGGVILRFALVNADIRDFDGSLFECGLECHRRYRAAISGEVCPGVGVCGVVAGVKVEHGAGDDIGERHSA